MQVPNMLETVIGARYRFYQRSVGLLILVTLTVLFVMLWMANRQFGFFTQTYHLYGFLDNVKNIQKTTPVTLAGLKIGAVRDLAITDYNRIRVALILDRSYQPRIRGGSMALVKTDLLGSAQIELNMGAPDQPMLQDEAEIAFVRSADLEVLLRQAQEQLAQVSAVLTNVKILTDELKKPEGALLGTLTAFARLAQDFSTRLSGSMERMDEVLRNVAELSGQWTPLLRNIAVVSGEMSRAATDLAAVSTRIRQGQGVLGGMTDSESPLSRHVVASAQKLQTVLTGLEKLSGQLPGYGRRIEQILRQTEVLTTRLAEASGRVPGLLDRSHTVAEDVDEVIGSVKQSALLRVLNPPQPGQPPLEAPRDMGWPIPAAPPH
ncbi:hypothetical protein BN874_720031 [Candidatus Contendobacter odensis Run_B_J11]|uniref:Mce/MlaD domain-containing protein n=2 Tax=Candidatus Contendibacter odensensis TaxID=1400860 RepID=A0A7U7J625_9GAMM|nr:hypothetical protein BN874_720031 [Candidatus Contendobacter odensis Run_B_J11]